MAGDGEREGRREWRLQFGDLKVVIICTDLKFWKIGVGGDLPEDT